MADRRVYVLNLNIGGVGKHGEIVEADPDLWAIEIEAGYMAEVDDDGERVFPVELVPTGPTEGNAPWLLDDEA